MYWKESLQFPSKTDCNGRGFVPWMAALLLLVAPGAAALDAAPDSLTFEARDDSHTVVLQHEGTPLPAAAVNEWRLLIDDHDYNHMLDVTVTDGMLTISPTAATEVGSFRLAVSTDFGELSIAVFTPLSNLPQTLENRARAMGITVDELKAHLGLTQVVGRERVALNLPPVFYTGQTLVATIPCATGRECRWTVNGETAGVRSTEGQFEYLFREAGVYIVGYKELEDGVEVASGFDVTTAIAEPTVKRSLPVGARMDFSGPEGYAQYTWTVNGLESGRDASFSHQFMEAGSYTVKVRASDPDTGKFRSVTYRVKAE